MSSTNNLTKKIDNKVIIRRILLSRSRLLLKKPFFGTLLYDMKILLDDNVVTAATEGKNIYFSPKFVDTITDSELDFIFMHELGHIILKHCFRLVPPKYNAILANFATDIVVNSIILKENNFNTNSIAVQGEVSMHLTPDGDEGYEYTAEQVYEMLLDYCQKQGMSVNCDCDICGLQISCRDGNGRPNLNEKGSFTDNHEIWQINKKNMTSEEIEREISALNEKLVSLDSQLKEHGSQSAMQEIALEDIKEEPILNWKELLHDLIQTEVDDYSFNLPDYRYSESEFFMPSFSEVTDKVDNVLFFIDCSGSMSSYDITVVVNEIKSCLRQFNHGVRGYIGTFDFEVSPLVRIDDSFDINKYNLTGGGGTSFENVFRKVDKEFHGQNVKLVIIMTDGEAVFPNEKNVLYPVLWIINNDYVKPPFGKVARLISDKKSYCMKQL